MNTANVLKEYLVSIGFDVDHKTYFKLNDTLDKAEKAVKKFAKEASESTKQADKETGDSMGSMGAKAVEVGKDYAKSAGLIATALATIGVATYSLLDKVAQMDLGYQKFALHMFLGRDAAREMKIAMDSLGESIEDIAWMPEIRERYFKLVNQSRAMEGPADIEKQLRYIRDIRFEFNRLQVEGTYGMRWIAYHMTQYLAGPLSEFKGGLKGINDWLTEHMPDWTDKVARFISTVFGVARSGWRFVTDIAEKITALWDMLPSWAKRLAAVLAVAFAPISPATKLIGGLILLIDDFYAYLDGRKSSSTLAPIWHRLLSITDSIKWNMVAAGRLIDKFINGSDKSYSEIIDQTKSEWRQELKDRLGDAYRDYDEKGNLKSTPSDAAAAHEKGVPVSWMSLIGGNKFDSPDSDKGFLGDFLGGLKYGIGNYKSTVDNSSYMVAPSSSRGDTKVEINVGGVAVHVTQPGATVKEVYDGTVSAVTDTMSKAVARNTRDMSGVY